jgi:ribosomal-protein-serine acetyltransferase
VAERRRRETERLTLSPVDPGLADGIWAATEASLAELRPWMVWAAASTEETTRTFTEEAAREWEDGTAYQFAILDDEGVAGAIGVDVPVPIRRMGEVGYWIRTDRTGRGYATEAGRELVRFGFEDLLLYRLELRAGLQNAASRRVAEKLGFRREGRMRRGCLGSQGGYDCYLYGLLATDHRP